jgi:hypothetical protein
MALTSAERVKAYRQKARDQGRTQRSIYLPEGEPSPTDEELDFLRQRRQTAQGAPAAGFPFVNPLQVTKGQSLEAANQLLTRAYEERAADIKVAVDRTRLAVAVNAIDLFLTDTSGSREQVAAYLCRELQITERELAGQGFAKKFLQSLKKYNAFIKTLRC